MRARTGSLLPCVVIHFVFNGVQGVLLALAPYLERYFPPEAPPPVPVPAPGLLVELFARLFGG